MNATRTPDQAVVSERGVAVITAAWVVTMATLATAAWIYTAPALQQHQSMPAARGVVEQPVSPSGEVDQSRLHSGISPDAGRFLEDGRGAHASDVPGASIAAYAP